MAILKRLGTVAAVAGLAAVGIAAAPDQAEAWWRGGYGVGIWIPPVVVAPPPVYYAPPPVYYRRRRWRITRVLAGSGFRRTGKGRTGCVATGRDAGPGDVHAITIDEPANRVHR